MATKRRAFAFCHFATGLFFLWSFIACLEALNTVGANSPYECWNWLLSLRYKPERWNANCPRLALERINGLAGLPNEWQESKALACKFLAFFLFIAKNQSDLFL